MSESLFANCGLGSREIHRRGFGLRGYGLKLWKREKFMSRWRDGIGVYIGVDDVENGGTFRPYSRLNDD